MDGVRDLIDGAANWSIECAADALGIGVVNLGLPRRGHASGLAVDVVQEPAAQGAAALSGGSCCVHHIDGPLDVERGPCGDALAAADSGHRVRCLGDWCWSWVRGGDGSCQQNGEGHAVEQGLDGRHYEGDEVILWDMSNVDIGWSAVAPGAREFWGLIEKP